MMMVAVVLSSLGCPLSSANLSLSAWSLGNEGGGRGRGGGGFKHRKGWEGEMGGRKSNN